VLVRKGSQFINVPVSLSIMQQYKLALKIIVPSIRKRKERSLIDRIITEFGLINTAAKCNSLETKKQLLEVAVKSRVYSHYY